MTLDLAGIDMDDLARRVAALTDPDALLGADDVGAWLKCSGRYVKEFYSKSPGFPRPMQLPVLDGRRSHPKWRRRDIVEWLDENSAGRVPNKRGARRKN